MGTPTRACTRCGEVKQLDDFPWRDKAEGKRHSRCRVCSRAAMNAAQRARRAADKANGVCMWSGCRAPAVPGRVRCAEHAKVHAIANRALRTDPEYRERGRVAGRAYAAANAARTEDEVARDRARLHPDGLKRCRSCGRSLPLDAFSKHSLRPDGLQAACRACDNADLLRAAAPKIDELDLYACTYCGGPAEAVDHVIPRKLGGTDDAVNLVPACKPCNSSKHAAPVLDWLSRRDPELVARVAAWPVEVVA